MISSWFSNTVQILNPETKTITDSYQDFLVPLNTVAFNKDIIVAELVGHHVVRRNIESGSTEVLMSGIAVPTGLATNNKELFAADWLTGSIFQLLTEGISLHPPLPIISGLYQPEGMAMDNQGRLQVVETGKKHLVRIDPTNPVIEVLADNLSVGLQGISGYPPNWLLSSIVVDECGRITLTQDLDNSLLRITPDADIPGQCN